MIRSNLSASHRSLNAWVSVRPFSIRASTGTHGGALNRLEQRHRNRYLVCERRVLRVPQRHDQQVRRHERRVLGTRDAQRGVENGGFQRAAAERHEDPALARSQLAQPKTAARGESNPEHDRKRGKCDNGGDHGVRWSRSARLATTRMSIPGSSRTIRESNDPPKSSRRRDSSGVPTNT
jgi:hypothetical protein